MGSHGPKSGEVSLVDMFHDDFGSYPSRAGWEHVYSIILVFTCLYLFYTLFSGRGYLRIVKSWLYRFLIAMFSIVE